MEINLFDLPQELLHMILMQPFSQALERTVLGRVCKTTADIVRGSVLSKQLVCGRAARYGHLDVLKWAVDNGCQLERDICDLAVRGGHLDVLKWLVANGCTFNMNYNDYLAKIYGHHDITLWLDDYARITTI